MTAQEELHTPEIDRLAAVAERSQAVAEFLDWLEEEHGVFLAHEVTYMVEREHFFTAGPHSTYEVELTETFRYGRRRDEMLADFFGVDLDRVERERRAVMDRHREQVEREARARDLARRAAA